MKSTSENQAIYTTYYTTHPICVLGEDEGEDEGEGWKVKGKVKEKVKGEV
jgi:hypothetical protein